MRHQQRQRGFSLIEVMIALTVIAIALGSLIKAGTTNASTTLYLRDKTFAQWVALNKLTELRLATSWAAKKEQTGTTEMAGHEYYWTVRVIGTEADDIRRAEVEVRLDEDIDSSASTLIGFLVDPGAT